MAVTRFVAPGAAGGHAHPRLAGDPRVAFGRERAPLLVARQDGANLLGPRQRLVDFHARAAGIGEDGVHALALERFDEDVAARHGPAHLGAGTAGSFGFLFGNAFAHVLSMVGAEGRRQNKKTHDRFGSRGFLLKLQFNFDKHQRRRRLRRLPDPVTSRIFLNIGGKFMQPPPAGQAKILSLSKGELRRTQGVGEIRNPIPATSPACVGSNHSVGERARPGRRGWRLANHFRTAPGPLFG